MVEGNGFWIDQRQSAWQLREFNCFDLNANVRQPESRPGYVTVSDLPVDNVTKINGPMNCVPSVLDVKATIPYEKANCQQKKFLIFDRSGEETRMLLSTLCSPILKTTYELPKEVHAIKPEKSRPKVPDLFEDLGENHVTDEEGTQGSAYREDTEEINALLYSDDENDDYFDEDEISTDHSPIPKEWDEFDDEVTSFERSSKRRKLLDTDSCCELSLKGESVVDCEKSRNRKIHDTLRVLRKLIPGSKSKDPLIVIDEAIDYLKTLKVKSLHMEETEIGPCQTRMAIEEIEKGHG